VPELVTGVMGLPEPLEPLGPDVPAGPPGLDVELVPPEPPGAVGRDLVGWRVPRRTLIDLRLLLERRFERCFRPRVIVERRVEWCPAPTIVGSGWSAVADRFVACRTLDRLVERVTLAALGLGPDMPPFVLEAGVDAAELGPDAAYAFAGGFEDVWTVEEPVDVPLVPELETPSPANAACEPAPSAGSRPRAP
jgi:hypothetical protein